MYSVTNSGNGPRTFYDQHKNKQRILPGQTIPMDLDSDTADFIAGLQRSGVPISIAKGVTEAADSSTSGEEAAKAKRK